MRYLSFFILFVFLFIAVGLAGAQMYEYRDLDGNVRFTDDLGKVPEDQREKVKRIQGVRSLPQPYSAHGHSEDEEAEPEWDGFGLEEEGSAREETIVDLFERGEALRAEQESLREAHALLLEERNRIGNPPDENAAPEEFSAYNARVEEINARIAAYQKRHEDLEKRIREHNARFGD